MANDDKQISKFNLKNILVHEKIKNEGLDSVVTWIHGIADEPKPTLRAIRTSLTQKISKKHSELMKNRASDAKTGKTGFPPK